MSSVAAEPVRLLVVEDDAQLSDVLVRELAERGYRPSAARSVAEAAEQLRAAEFDVALLDLNLPDGNGLDVLRSVVEQGLETECVVLTGHAEVSTAIEAMKLGACDYLSKPARMDELEVVVAKAAERSTLRRDNAALRVRVDRHEPVHGLVTEDPGMRKLIATLDRAAPSELPILIQGESGTGKELIARAVHKRSPRSRQAFVAINCAAVPENIIESELFGHERGAFTGASERKPGLFEVAHRGVLFLDEIGDLGLTLQAKLLRVLETMEFFRVGGTRLVQVDVRVVSASNKDLLEAIEQGTFREDLYYRLNGVTLLLPPLRERRGDIPLLARHFLDRLGSSRSLSARAVTALMAYHWPGNVRELEMVVQRADLLSDGDAIEAEDLPLHGPRRPKSGGGGLSTDLTLAEMEAEYIRLALARHGGHRGRTAAALGIDPKTLYNKLKTAPRG